MKFKTKIMTTEDIKRCFIRLALEIIEKNDGVKDICLIGLKEGGVIVSKMVKNALKEITTEKVLCGNIDISLFRDDLVEKFFIPNITKNNIDFDFSNKIVILCDDVLFTGRSARAGIEAIFKIARPKKIQLLVLCDRGHREMPIRADFIGKNIPTSLKEKVEMSIKENCINSVDLYEI